MTATSRSLTVSMVVGLVLLVGPSVHAGDNALGLRFDGGTILPYDAPDDVGNGAQLVITLDYKDLQFGVGGGVALPASRTETAFPVIHLSVSWHLWRQSDWVRRTLLSPYVSLGAGVAAPDNPGDDAETDELVRWVTDEPEFLGLLGIGATYGGSDGVYLLGEVRAVNPTHLALVVGGGIRF